MKVKEKTFIRHKAEWSSPGLFTRGYLTFCFTGWGWSCYSARAYFQFSMFIYSHREQLQLYLLSAAEVIPRLSFTSGQASQGLRRSQMLLQIEVKKRFALESVYWNWNCIFFISNIHYLILGLYTIKYIFIIIMSLA